MPQLQASFEAVATQWVTTKINNVKTEKNVRLEVHLSYDWRIQLTEDSSHKRDVESLLPTNVLSGLIEQDTSCACSLKSHVPLLTHEYNYIFSSHSDWLSRCFLIADRTRLHTQCS